jgi:hypothetical protein
MDSNRFPVDGAETEHLDDVDDGCGCAEVWEHLAEHRGGSRSE